MNREIKFRGKRIKNAEWITGSLFTRNTEAWIFSGDDIDCFDGECSMWVDIDSEVVLKTVGQYTGLKDKNGKEIYEGDMVRHRGYNGMKISVVAFSDGCFNVGRHQGSSTKETPMLITANCEVIGNIHDNPELLKGGDK